MLFLTLLSYLATLIQLCFLTVAVAAGLYYLAELVEEFPSQGKRIVWWMNFTVLLLYILLWIFESFPIHIIACGLLAHLCHFAIISSFPFASIQSPFMILALIFVVVNHYLAFSYFPNNNNTLSEILAYFTLFLWLVPLSLFVSLSLSDTSLPTVADQPDIDAVSSYLSNKRKKYGFLSLLSYAKETVLPIRTKKGF
ncbi:protein TEX261 [Dendroctonus ponderosae]|uniref:protein TEX261 n=1 Tax=Dendroctonus ponderosae TaxID=77166 RepID=UPI002035F75B|nr:protein TEX261 [Dendroctonus ponderosae]KAH1012157.1 hypothetical protein HUJ05_011366 [Dendroctonus ponderosae]